MGPADTIGKNNPKQNLKIMLSRYCTSGMKPGSGFRSWIMDFKRRRRQAVLLGLLAVGLGFDMSAKETASPGLDPSPELVYLLLFGGQSNALGWGHQQYLLETGHPLAYPQEDVWMFYRKAGEGTLPMNEILALQSGTSNLMFREGGYYPEVRDEPISRFGPELSFARTVKDALVAAGRDEPLVVVKFAHGGTNLYEHWYPAGSGDAKDDGRLYRIFQDTVEGALNAVAERFPNRRPVVIGMGWVQGESDAIEKRGAEYAEHLQRLIEDVRTKWGDRLIFVLSEVSPNQTEGSRNQDWLREWERVRQAQQAVATADPLSRSVPTQGERFATSADSAEGRFHFTSQALLEIGRDMGKAWAAVFSEQLAGGNDGW
jgi:hypothetical protein